jgi:hypothetical protein
MYHKREKKTDAKEKKRQNLSPLSLFRCIAKEEKKSDQMPLKETNTVHYVD